MEHGGTVGIDFRTHEFLILVFVKVLMGIDKGKGVADLPGLLETISIGRQFSLGAGGGSPEGNRQ